MILYGFGGFQGEGEGFVDVVQVIKVVSVICFVIVLGAELLDNWSCFVGHIVNMDVHIKIQVTVILGLARLGSLDY